MTLLSGPQSGVRGGVRSGVNAGYGAAATVDATSGIYVPISAAEYTALGITAPASIWTCQETSGDLDDKVGILDLVAANSPTYQNSITGWTKKAVGGVPGSFNCRFSVAGPDVAATSVLLMAYVHVTSGTTATLQFFECGDVRVQQLAGTDTIRARNTSNGADTVNAHTGVTLIILMHDLTNSRTRLFTQLEKLTVTYAASSGTNLQMSPSAGAEPVGHFKFLYAAIWTGSDAELSDAQAKARAQGLGWSIPWS